jgi:TldD protein
MFSRELLEETLRSVAGHSRYADLRITRTERQDVRVRNGRTESIAAASDFGAGVRVLHGNGWGFAATSEVTPESLKRIAAQALEVAKASHIATSDEIVLAPHEAIEGEWSSTCQIDPWSIPAERKATTLLEALSVMEGVAQIHQAFGEISSYRQEKLFASSDGSFLRQTTTEMGCGMEAVAIAEGEFQRRNYPNPVGGDYAARGWEFVEGLALRENAERIRDEAIALLTAPKAPAGRFDLVIGSSQLALQIHESCGHPAELDRALGWEISLAGGSFLQPSMLGNFRYGSELVTIVADATIPHSIGSFAWDDDGTPAQRAPLIERGMFVDYLTGRDTAPMIGKRSNGTVRAESATRIPLIRMTNINLEPGDASLEQLIGETKRGIFVDTNKSWSIDDLRLNFQFGCEVAWEIVDGKLGRMLKNPLYTGSTPEFWGSCDRVGDASTWKLWGLPNCGKGDPMQTMRVAHGAPAGRFRNVEMG